MNDFTKTDQNKYHESYRGVNFIVAQKQDLSWIAITETKISPNRFASDSEAYAYGIGYIDGFMENSSE
jgi:hypothetical protein